MFLVHGQNPCIADRRAEDVPLQVVEHGVVAVAVVFAEKAHCPRQTLPEKESPDCGGPPQTFPHVDGHQREWIAACKGGSEPLSGFNHCGPSIELMLLGNVASLVNPPLEFDPAACKILGDDEADRALRSEHRKG